MKKINLKIMALLLPAVLLSGNPAIAGKTETGVYVKSGEGYKFPAYQSLDSHTTFDSAAGKITFHDDGTVDILNPISYMPTGSVLKGKLDKSEGKNRIVVDLPQPALYFETLSMSPMLEGEFNIMGSEDGKTFGIVNRQLIYEIEENGTVRMEKFPLSENGLYPLFMLAITDKDGKQVGSSEYGSVFTPSQEKQVEFPDGLTMEEWEYVFGDNEESAREVRVAFTHNKVFIHGLFKSFPQAYIEGTRNGENMTFDKDQYLGVDPKSFFQCSMYGGQYMAVDNGFWLHTFLSEVSDVEMKLLDDMIVPVSDMTNLFAAGVKGEGTPVFEALYKFKLRKKGAGVENVTERPEVSATEYYTLQGQRTVGRETTGPVIKIVRYSDGTVETSKELNIKN